MTAISITKEEAKAMLALADAFLNDAKHQKADSPTRIILPLIEGHINSLRSKILKALKP